MLTIAILLQQLPSKMTNKISQLKRIIEKLNYYSSPNRQVAETEKPDLEVPSDATDEINPLLSSHVSSSLNQKLIEPPSAPHVSGIVMHAEDKSPRSMYCSRSLLVFTARPTWIKYHEFLNQI